MGIKKFIECENNLKNPNQLPLRGATYNKMQNGVYHRIPTPTITSACVGSFTALEKSQCICFARVCYYLLFSRFNYRSG